MRKFFENPEMMINVFDGENVVTTSNLTPDAAKNAIYNGSVKLDGMGNDGAVNAAATQIFAFKN